MLSYHLYTHISTDIHATAYIHAHTSFTHSCASFMLTYMYILTCVHVNHSYQAAENVKVNAFKTAQAALNLADELKSKAGQASESRYVCACG